MQHYPIPNIGHILSGDLIRLAKKECKEGLYSEEDFMMGFSFGLLIMLEIYTTGSTKQ